MFRLLLGFGFLKNPVDTYRDSTRPWIYKVVPVAVEETKNGWQNCFVVVSVGFDVNARMIAQVVFFSSVHFHPLPEVWGWNSICFAGCLAGGGWWWFTCISPTAIPFPDMGTFEFYHFPICWFNKFIGKIVKEIWMWIGHYRLFADVAGGSWPGWMNRVIYRGEMKDDADGALGVSEEAGCYTG